MALLSAAHDLRVRVRWRGGVGPFWRAARSSVLKNTASKVGYACIGLNKSCMLLALNT